MLRDAEESLQRETTFGTRIVRIYLNFYPWKPLPASSVVLHSFGNSLYNKGCLKKEAVTNDENTQAGNNQ